MKYLLKFNEAEEPKILSNDKIEERNKDIALSSTQVDDLLEKYNKLDKEIELFTSKKSTNNQISKINNVKVCLLSILFNRPI